MATKTPTERIEALRRNLAITTDLIGPDVKDVHPEYIRALSEFACMASGVSTDRKEAVIALAIELAYTTDPEGNVDALIEDLEASADLIGRNALDVSTANSEYIRGLTEHACFAADISGHHADSVQDVLIGILTND